MTLKLRDEKKYLKELLITKNKMHAEIDKELKKNSKPSRRLLKEFREESAKIRVDLREKYRRKIEHLSKKYREKKNEMMRRIPLEMIELGGLKVFDPQRYEEIETEEYEVKVIGDVQLDENELKVLKLHPKFAILPKLCEGGLDLDEELANSKLRMQISKEMEERRNAENQEVNDIIEEKSEDDRVNEIEIEARSRQVFNPVERIYDERKRRVTDLRECNRVTLPKPLPASEEAKIEIRREIHKKVYDKYREENCNKYGEQRSNLTKEEQAGLKSLEKRIKERSLIVIKTDKSSRFAVVSEEAYLRLGQVHTGKDKIITRKELIETEKLLNAHCVAWGKVWRSGDDHDHRGRIINSKKTASENTADLYILLKDHKEGEKTRPIVTGCTSNTLGMSNNTASVLEAIAASEEEAFESISSEDMLAKCKDYNENVRKRHTCHKEEQESTDLNDVNNREKEEQEEKSEKVQLVRSQISISDDLKANKDLLVREQISISVDLKATENENEKDFMNDQPRCGLLGELGPGLQNPTDLISQEPAGEAAEVLHKGVCEGWDAMEARKNENKEKEKVEEQLVRPQISISEDLKANNEQLVREQIFVSADLKANENEKEIMIDNPRCGLAGEQGPGRKILPDLTSQEPAGEAGEVRPEGVCKGCEELDDTCLIGCDVVALFPSLTSRRTGEIIRERVRKSKLNFEGFDYEQGLRYIVLNKHLTGNLKEIAKILPWRRKEGGTVPKMTGAMGNKLDDDPEGQWVFPKKEKDFNEVEKKEVISRCVEIGVRVVFDNFCYKFGGDTLRQGSGGPIGARVTMAAARIVMQTWSEDYRRILEAAGLRVGLLTGYVDDVRQISTCLKEGIRFSKDNKRFEYSEEAKKEDQERRIQGESKNGRMARVCQQAMNSVNEDLQFTVEVPEDFENEKLPTLDFSLWMENGLLVHTYYQKSMKTPFVVMERSAMGSKQKMEILSNEVVRRLTNVDHERLGVEEQRIVLEQMTQELKNSGYKIEQARDIIISGFRGWKRRIERRKVTGLYRAAKDTLEAREKKKLVEKETWYIPRDKDDEEVKKPDNRKILVAKRRIPGRKMKSKLGQVKKEKPGLTKAVMFAPCTVGSQLVKELRSAENMLGDSTGAKLKVVERCGTKIADILTSSDPWKGKDCMREGCLLCQTKSLTGKLLSQDCRKRSIVYETHCITCEERSVKRIEEKYENEDDKEQMKDELKKIKMYKYIGETGKSCFERGLQHLSDAAQLKPSSHILKHFLDSHENEKLEEITFGMKIRYTARSAFERQIMESVLIQQESSAHNILNSKSEYNRCALPRVTTKLGEEEFEEWRKEKLEEKKKEDDLERRIRILRKERNRGRQVQINTKHLPPKKKRKIADGQYKNVKQMFEDWNKEERETEKEEIRLEDHKYKKKRKVEKEIGENSATVTEDKIEIEEKTELDGINWDEEIATHRKEIEAEIVKDEEQEKQKDRNGTRLRMIENYDQSWELLVECVEYLRENEESWKKGSERRRREKEKMERLAKANFKRKEDQKKHLRKIIDEQMKSLTVKEREKIEREEIIGRRMELKTIKEELWEHRGKEKKGNYLNQKKKGESTLMREKLEKILEAKERMRKEKVLEDEKKRKMAEKMEELRKKRRIDELKILEKREDRRKRIEKKMQEEKRWEMTRWLHSYIEENSSNWEKEKIRRIEERKERIEAWERNSRFEKIKVLKEKLKNKRKTEDTEADLTGKEFIDETEKLEETWIKWRTDKNDDEKDDEEDTLETDEPSPNEKDEVVNEEEEAWKDDENEELLICLEKTEEEHDMIEGLKLENDDFCLNCVYKPCLCILLKVEMKLDGLKKTLLTPNNLEEISKLEDEDQKKGRNLMGGVGEVTVQKLPPVLYCNNPDQQPNIEDEDKNINCTVHQHPHLHEGDAGEHEHLVRQIILELINKSVRKKVTILNSMQNSSSLKQSSIGKYYQVSGKTSSPMVTPLPSTSRRLINTGDSKVNNKKLCSPNLPPDSWVEARRTRIGCQEAEAEEKQPYQTRPPTTTPHPPPTSIHHPPKPTNLNGGKREVLRGPENKIQHKIQYQTPNQHPIRLVTNQPTHQNTNQSQKLTPSPVKLPGKLGRRVSSSIFEKFNCMLSGELRPPTTPTSTTPFPTHQPKPTTTTQQKTPHEAEQSTRKRKEETPVRKRLKEISKTSGSPGKRKKQEEKSKKTTKKMSECLKNWLKIEAESEDLRKLELKRKERLQNLRDKSNPTVTQSRVSGDQLDHDGVGHDAVEGHVP